ncbi:MAG: hypothetical protein ABFQ53_01965 [Patescibacteria group bacterium]
MPLGLGTFNFIKKGPVEKKPENLVEEITPAETEPPTTAIEKFLDENTLELKVKLLEKGLDEAMPSLFNVENSLSTISETKSQESSFENSKVELSFTSEDSLQTQITLYYKDSTNIDNVLGSLKKKNISEKSLDTTIQRAFHNMSTKLLTRFKEQKMMELLEYELNAENATNYINWRFDNCKEKDTMTLTKTELGEELMSDNFITKEFVAEFKKTLVKNEKPNDTEGDVVTSEEKNAQLNTLQEDL